MKVKLCSGCSKRKQLRQFYKGSGAGGRQSFCKVCCRERNAARYADPARAQQLRRRVLERMMAEKYELTLEDWARMYEAQDGRCACCRDSIPPSGHDTHTDHIHGTTTVRGILCAACNLLLGYAKDSTHRLECAVAYLSRLPVSA